MKKILIVGHNQSNLAMCGDIVEEFKLNGIKVFSADSICNAYDMLNAINFDLVVACVAIREGSGRETVQTIRSIKSQLKIIAVADSVDPNYILDLARQGANKIVCRDSPLSELIQTIKDVIDF